MSSELLPDSVPELIEIVRSTPRLLAIGQRTKPSLSEVESAKLSMTKLSGITEYDPSEFTFTAMAGTSLREIISALKERGQHLPFDPPLVEAGATLGGTVAAGLSGPGRFRFGGLRDFILGVKFVDGSARLLRMGGKVVKNAAGFDLPKFFIGSLGRFGVLVELTFKVFPAPRESLTLQLEAREIEAATRILIEAGNSRWEPYALDILPGKSQVLLRLGGPAAPLQVIAAEILARWPGVKLSAEQADSVWSELGEFKWIYPEGLLIKTPLTVEVIPEFAREMRKLKADVRLQVSSGGNAGFISLPSASSTSELDLIFQRLKLTGLTLRGSGPRWYGKRAPSNIAAAIKRALDPINRFPSLDD